jgi:hypothetical protein
VSREASALGASAPHGSSCWTKQRQEKEHRQEDYIAAAKEGLGRATKLQGQIWEQAVAACRETNYQPATMLLLPAMNSMIDITTTRAMAFQMHPPTIIFVMLCGMALAASLLAGYGMAGAKSPSWVLQACLRSDPSDGGVCHYRPRVPAPGVDSSRCLRSGAGGTARKYGVN